MQICRRLVDTHKARRLKEADGKPSFNVRFYALNKKGQFGAASIWSGTQFAVNTGESASRLEKGAYLYKK